MACYLYNEQTKEVIGFQTVEEADGHATVGLRRFEARPVSQKPPRQYWADWRQCPECSTYVPPWRAKEG
jgi:hypothetical protein